MCASSNHDMALTGRHCGGCDVARRIDLGHPSLVVQAPNESAVAVEAFTVDEDGLGQAHPQPFTGLLGLLGHSKGPTQIE